MPLARLERTRRNQPEVNEPKPALGISIRFIRSYDIKADVMPLRYDVWECPRCGVYTHYAGICVNCLRGPIADATGEP